MASPSPLLNQSATPSSLASAMSSIVEEEEDMFEEDSALDYGYYEDASIIDATNDIVIENFSYDGISETNTYASFAKYFNYSQREPVFASTSREETQSRRALKEKLMSEFRRTFELNYVIDINLSIKTSP